MDANGFHHADVCQGHHLGYPCACHHPHNHLYHHCYHKQISQHTVEDDIWIVYNNQAKETRNSGLKRHVPQEINHQLSHNNESFPKIKGMVTKQTARK